MSTEASETKNEQAAKQAPTEQQESKAGVPKRFAVGQTVCNEKNEKGKLCNGHLKERNTAHPAEVHLRGDDALHQCQTCGTLYMGPPLGHVRDSRKQSRYVERDLAAILRAAGGTLPAYTYPVPEWRRASLPASAPAANPPAAAGTPAEAPPPPAAPPKPAPAARAEARTAPTVSAAPATPPPASSAAPEGETPQQKRARIIAELNAKYAGKTAPPRKKKTDEETAAATPAQAPTSESATAADSSAPVVDSSAEADRHRPAAEAQAATGQASAAPLSPAAATASPAAGAETVADLAADASTELTPGAPKADAPPAAEAAPEKRKAAGQRNRGPRELPPHLRPPEGETHEEKIARLTAFVEEAKRTAGKL